MPPPDPPPWPKGMAAFPVTLVFVKVNVPLGAGRVAMMPPPSAPANTEVPLTVLLEIVLFVMLIVPPSYRTMAPPPPNVVFLVMVTLLRVSDPDPEGAPLKP